MTIRQKLEIIQKSTGLTQTKLAARFGVSFAAFNSWWTGKATPRPKMQAAIEELLLEVTGQKVVPEDVLTAKKQTLQEKNKGYKSIINEILKAPDIRDTFLLKLTYNSNRMEGSTLSEPDTAAILFDNLALPNKSLNEQLEAKNHQTALQYLFNHVAKNEPIDENLVLKLHGILMNGIYDEAGFYRQHPVRITGVHLATANYMKVPVLMKALMKKSQRKSKDVIKEAAIIHARFEHIHPFPDGNGRVGRLLLNAMLLAANIAPAVIKQEYKRLYNTYLYEAQTKEDYSQLEGFICDSILEGYRILERG